MATTLAERIKERLAATGLSNAQLATASGVKPPTSFNWGSGKTKNIKGEPLLLAARALGVTPEWLSTGKGEKLRDTRFDPAEVVPHLVSDHHGSYPGTQVSIGRARARMLLERLPESAVTEAILHMEWLEEKHKKTNGADGNG